jgi:hypothetical protein
MNDLLVRTTYCQEVGWVDGLSDGWVLGNGSLEVHEKKKADDGAAT